MPRSNDAASPMPVASPVKAGIVKGVLNPYIQVALTYVRRPLGSWLGGILSIATLFMLVPTLIVERGRYYETPPPAAEMFPFLFPAFIVFLYLAVHMKDQFADARARLTPGFLRVHLAVAMAAMLLCVVLLPATITLIQGWHSVGLVTLTILMFVAVLWGVVTNLSNGYLLILPVFLLMISAPARLAVQEFLSGKYEPLAVLLLCVGVMAGWLGMQRLAGLTEDDSESYRRFQWDRNGQFQMTGQAPAGGGSLQQRLTNRSMDRAMCTLARHARNAPASRWSRICRWQIGTSAVSSLCGLCIFTFVYLQMMAWVMPDIFQPGRGHAVAPAVLTMLIIPMCILFAHLTGRRPMMGRKLLLPVTRRQYVRQWILATAVTHLWLWSGMVVAVVLWWMLNAQQPHARTTLAPVLLFSAVTQVLLFGVIVWAGTVRSRAFGFGAMVIAFAAAQGVGSLGLEAPLPKAMPILAGAILAVVGMLFLWHGYRRWLVADLD